MLTYVICVDRLLAYKKYVIEENRATTFIVSEVQEITSVNQGIFIYTEDFITSPNRKEILLEIHKIVKSNPENCKVIYDY